MELPSYRDLIRTELLERCKRNPAYSARALARDLAVSPAYLSLMLNGRKHLNEDRAVQFAKVFRWNKKKTKLFSTLVRFSSAKDPDTRANIYDEFQRLESQSGVQYFDLKIDAFHVVSDWYHFAILELTEIEGFESESAWIAKKLGIQKVEADLAIERLLRLELLRWHKDQLVKSTRDYAINNTPSAAIRNFHKQVIAKSLEAVDQQDFDTRHLTAGTFSLNAKQIKAVKNRMDLFRDEIIELAAKSNSPDRVYQLNMQLFRLDRGD